MMLSLFFRTIYRTTWDMCTTFLVRFYLFFTFIQNSELNDNVKIIIVHQLFWWRLLFEFFVCMLGETKKNTWPWSCHWFKGFCCQIKKLMLNKKNQCGSWNNLKNWKTKNKISSSKVWKETLNNNLKKPLATWSAKPDKKYDPNHKLLRNKASQSQKKKSRKPQNKSF